jgi:hypothetical protein
MDQEQGATSGWRSRRLESGVIGARCIDCPGGYERTVMGLPVAGGRDPYGTVAADRQQFGAGAGEQEEGKRRAMEGASGRCEANEAAGQAA